MTRTGLRQRDRGSDNCTRSCRAFMASACRAGRRLAIVDQVDPSRERRDDGEPLIVYPLRRKWMRLLQQPTAEPHRGTCDDVTAQRYRQRSTFPNRFLVVVSHADRGEKRFAEGRPAAIDE